MGKRTHASLWLSKPAMLAPLASDDCLKKKEKTSLWREDRNPRVPVEWEPGVGVVLVDVNRHVAKIQNKTRRYDESVEAKGRDLYLYLYYTPKEWIYFYTISHPHGPRRHQAFFLSFLLLRDTDTARKNKFSASS